MGATLPPETWGLLVGVVALMNWNQEAKWLGMRTTAELLGGPAKMN